MLHVAELKRKRFYGNAKRAQLGYYALRVDATGDAAYENSCDAGAAASRNLNHSIVHSELQGGGGAKML